MTRKHLYPNAQNTEPRAPENEFEAAMEQVLGELREGLIHGFFDYSMSCEIVGGAKRRFTLRAGKSHRFVIPEEALD
jgi:hypothetical protein